MNVTPYLLVKRSTVVALAERAGAALARWGAEWAPLPDGGVTCAAASASEVYRAAPANWRPRTLGDGVSVWVNVQAGLERSLEQILFDLLEEDPSGDTRLRSPIATKVSADALDDLLASLIYEFTGQRSEPADPAPLPDRLFRAGSGTVLCSIGLGDKTIRLLIPGIALELAADPQSAHSAEGRAVAPLQDALAGLPVKLSIELSETEIPLGYLRTLALGDVLALPAGVDEPLRVAGPDGRTLCHAHLGSLKGHHAVEVVKQ